MKRDQEKVSRREKDGEPSSNGEVLGKKVMNSPKNPMPFLSGIAKVLLSMLSRVNFLIFFRFKAKRKDTRTGFPWGFCFAS